MERKKNAYVLRQELKDVPGLQLLDEPEGYESANWLFTVLVDDKDAFYKKMMDKKIPVKMVNWGIDQEPCFADLWDEGCDLPGQEYFDDHHICIPSHENLSDNELVYIVRSIRDGW